MEHPLVAWLARKGIAAYQFADQHGLPRRTVYNQIAPPFSAPTAKVMLAIERATAGRGCVTVKKQMEWLEQRQ